MDKQFEDLKEAFAAFPEYELRYESHNFNPITLVHLVPVRRVVWRTRSSHVAWAMLNVLKFERGLR